MDSHYDYKRYAILYVDDEEKSLTNFRRAFNEHFRTLTANNAEDGIKLLEAHADEIGVVVSDQRMPGMKGVQFLERTRLLRPRIIRILATAFSDLDAAIDSVNTGAIYKYVTKPWDPLHFEHTLRRSLEFFIVQRERDELLREKLSVLHKMVITDRVLSLGVLAAGLGHHVRNAMSAVRTFLDLAPEMLHRESIDINQLRHPTFWQDFHRKVQDRVKILIDLLDDLAANTKENAFEFDTALNLGEAVNLASAEIGDELSKRRIQVLNQIPADLPHPYVDEPKMRKLFQLILREELANLPDGSMIRFEANAVEAQGAKPAGVELVIHDNGPGLPKDAILSVFDPFFVRNDSPNEFGIYLMACYFIVYHHGGSVLVLPANEGGLTFRIFLPLKPVSGTPAEEGEDFLVRVMTNERLWEKLLATA
ncbi:MAG TPA: hybrid sensor histidine kinase/response regulator [Candidatus Limnocylindria bacterium]|jgi:two-component system probable response regulator PhcQ|nr:hybrid sensor histidine kinase/response regulator [Candidatus Limnocylindria bacterium]